MKLTAIFERGMMEHIVTQSISSLEHVWSPGHKAALVNLNSLTLALLSNKDLRDQYPSKEFIGYLKMLLMSENAGVVGRRVSGVCGEEVEMSKK